MLSIKNYIKKIIGVFSIALVLASCAPAPAAAQSSQFSCAPLPGSACGVVLDVTLDNHILEVQIQGFNYVYCNGAWGVYKCPSSGTVRVLNGDIPIELAADIDIEIKAYRRVLYCFKLFGPSVCQDQPD